MGRTTDEWAALLDGTTPGPWWTETQRRLRYANGEIWEEIGDILVCSDVELTPLMSLPEQTAEDEEQGPNNLSNAELAALAPEAVAEVIRLRRAIDGIRQFVERFPLVPPLVGTGSTEARAYEMQEKVRHALARILEGDTDDPA